MWIGTNSLGLCVGVSYSCESSVKENCVVHNLYNDVLATYERCFAPGPAWKSRCIRSRRHSSDFPNKPDPAVRSCAPPVRHSAPRLSSLLDRREGESRPPCCCVCVWLWLCACWGQTAGPRGCGTPWRGSRSVWTTCSGRWRSWWRTRSTYWRRLWIRSASCFLLHRLDMYLQGSTNLTLFYHHCREMVSLF